MNVFVMVDIEGISGVYTRTQVLQNESRFNEGRRFMTADINACVKGLKAAGVDKVYVCDCHGGSHSVIWDELSDDADYYICGSTNGKRYVGIEDCDAVILLGYHAMAGTANAVLDHSWNSKAIQSIWINGSKAGEIAFDASVAGEYGKPIIMVSGDDTALSEAKALLPDAVMCEVKKSMSVYGAMLLPPGKAHKLIYQKSIEAVKNFKNCKPFRFDTPIHCKVEVTERTPIPADLKLKGAKIIDGRTFEATADNTEDLIFGILNF